MKTLLRIALTLSFFQIYAQDFISSKNTTISVLTIGPGENLNDAFGHNAFRVKTPFSDVIYDYGRFNYDEPGFYLNFAKGKLNYFMGSSSYSRFKDFYIWQDRTIKEQVLNLSDEENKKLITFLKNNLKPENKFYLYDFFFDNCATKIRDVAQKTIPGDIDYGTPEVYKEESFRTLIRQNLDWNSWGSMGIDVALGSVIDRKSKAYDYMFLPENIYNFFETASLKNTGKKLVRTNTIVYKQKEDRSKGNFFISPFFIFSLIAITIIYFTYKDLKNNHQSKWLDLVILSVTGLIGILILFLWFGTNHSATAQNYNLLWACPISLLTLFQITKKAPKKWCIGYLKFLVVMLCLMALHWTIGVQSFAPTLIPILIALAFRYVFLVLLFQKKKV